MTEQQTQKPNPYYEGNIQPNSSESDLDDLYPYIPGDNLKKAVNIAIALEKPLLIQGEPGCGKTLLASAIAYEFGQRYLNGTEWPFFAWAVTSRSRADEARYTFDALGRLRDTQFLATGKNEIDSEQEEKLRSRLNNPASYIQWGPIGKAFNVWEIRPDLKKIDCNVNLRPILLIDEIDKADIDLPNDLLRDLDQWYFEVKETQAESPEKRYRKAHKPIVIITSNQERPLPEAFLRRCLFFYLEFPSEPQLTRIIEERFKRKFKDKTPENIIETAIKKFCEIRDTAYLQKPPTTSELIDWLSFLLTNENTATQIAEVLNDPAQIGILLKSQSDIETLNRYRE
jgi:MoxR-like ATPase